MNENVVVSKQNGKPRISIPDYRLSEELVSAISHGVGAGLAIAAMVICIVKAASSGPWSVVSACIYGSMLILLYMSSTLYHSLAKNRAKKVFRVLDHCSIYLLIAGTYTPFTLVPLRGAVGWVLFGVIWGLAIVGIVFDAIHLDRFEKLALVLYILMGWAVIVTFPQLRSAVSKECVTMLLLGGVVYTIGAVLYVIGSKKRYFHSVWHFFVLGGSILHFFSVYFLL